MSANEVFEPCTSGYVVIVEAGNLFYKNPSSDELTSRLPISDEASNRADAPCTPNGMFVSQFTDAQERAVPKTVGKHADHDSV